MTQINPDKYSVAWFKLAEFVVRKEKEKALGIFKLLSYSIKDSALISQLEGDLLLSFQDSKAIESYHRAAIDYENSERFIEACAVYEHLLNLETNSIEYAQKILDLSKNVKNEAKILRSWCLLFEVLAKKNMWKEIDDRCAQATNFFEDSRIIHEEVVNIVLRQKSYEKKFLHYHLNRAIEYLLEVDNKKLQQFIARLAASDNDAYKHASRILEKN
ncbi:hypothetical protein M1446_02475 [Candidatus Dependentiae bacterium]|nr:hypothetical protein [Candidatus Dependentiae bacterium]